VHSGLEMLEQQGMQPAQHAPRNTSHREGEGIITTDMLKKNDDSLSSSHVVRTNGSHSTDARRRRVATLSGRAVGVASLVTI
jgi:hypothetical protein